MRSSGTSPPPSSSSSLDSWPPNKKSRTSLNVNLALGMRILAISSSLRGACNRCPSLSLQPDCHRTSSYVAVYFSCTRFPSRSMASTTGRRCETGSASCHQSAMRFSALRGNPEPRPPERSVKGSLFSVMGLPCRVGPKLLRKCVLRGRP